MGKYNASRANGLELWKKFGLWAPRRLAAFDYVQAFGSFSPTRDSAAASLPPHAPDPLARATPLDVGAPPLAPAAKLPPDQPLVDPKTGIVKLCRTPQPTVMRSPAQSDSGPPNAPMDMDAIASKVGKVRRETSPRIDRARTSKDLREVYRREAPPSPENAPDTDSHGESQGDVTRGAKFGRIRGEQRGSFPSPQTSQSRPGSSTQQRKTRRACSRGTHTTDWANTVFRPPGGCAILTVPANNPEYGRVFGALRPVTP